MLTFNLAYLRDLLENDVESQVTCPLTFTEDKQVEMNSQGAHTSSVFVYVRNIKKCTGEF